MSKYSSEESITTRLRITKFVEVWEKAGYTETEPLIENFPEEPKDEDGESIDLTLRDLKILLSTVRV